MYTKWLTKLNVMYNTFGDMKIQETEQIEICFLEYDLLNTCVLIDCVLIAKQNKMTKK